jgi:hypothetical protein
MVAARAFAQQRHARYIIVRSYKPIIAAALPRTISVRLAQRRDYCYKFKASFEGETSWETGPSDGYESGYESLSVGASFGCLGKARSP